MNRTVWHVQSLALAYFFSTTGICSSWHWSLVSVTYGCLQQHLKHNRAVMCTDRVLGRSFSTKGAHHLGIQRTFEVGYLSQAT